jgi:hypothetical protein
VSKDPNRALATGTSLYMPLGSCRKLREGTLNAAVAAVTGIGPQNKAEAIARRRGWRHCSAPAGIRSAACVVHRDVMKLDSTLKLAVYVLRVIVCIAVLGIILLIWPSL